MRFDGWKRRMICGLFWVRNKYACARNFAQNLPSYLDKGRKQDITPPMTKHISTSRMKRFCVRALPVRELTSIAEHLAACPPCQEEFTQALRSRRGPAPLKFTLAPEFELRHDHVDYEQLVGLTDNSLDAAERTMIDVHLRVCASCQEDIRSFLAVREQIDKETQSSYAPIAPGAAHDLPWLAWWRGIAWKPIYATTVVLIAMALVIGVALFLKRRAANLEAKRTQPDVKIGAPTQTPTPVNQSARNVLPTPVPVPSQELPPRAPSPSLSVKNREPLKQSENAGTVAVLNDGSGTVTVDKAGNVSGLDEIPQNMRHQIAEALVAEKIKAPEIESELAGGPISLRGPGKGPTFKLLSPARVVIISDRPSFEWEQLAGATSYRVSIGDLKGHEVATSEDLAPNYKTWTPPLPLKRGEIYSWAVEATVGGKKIFSPGASAPEMKFKILSGSSAQELEELKKARSHLALGVFYAREGMIDEAEREFQLLLQLNPTSKVMSKLVNNLRLLRTPR